MVSDTFCHHGTHRYAMGADTMVHEDQFDLESPLVDPFEHTLVLPKQGLQFHLNARLSKYVEPLEEPTDTKLAFDMRIRTAGWVTNMEFVNMLVQCLEWVHC